MFDPPFSSHRAVALLVAVTCSVAAGWVAPHAARADTAIAADIDYLAPREPDELDSGGGFAIRLGQQIEQPSITLTPELGFGWGRFGDEAAIYRGVVGVRLALGEVFRFGVSGHIGFGHSSFDYEIVEASHTGFTYDVGAFLDITVVPLFDVGIHLTYTGVEGEDDLGGAPDLSWVGLGAHFALVL